MDDEDCKKWEAFNDPWAVWSRDRDATDEADDSDSKVTAPVLPTAQPVTTLDGNERRHKLSDQRVELTRHCHRPSS